MNVSKSSKLKTKLIRNQERVKMLSKFEYLKKNPKIIPGLIEITRELPWQEYHDLCEAIKEKKLYCGFGLAYQPNCKEITWGEGFCKTHKNEKCCVCKKQASYQCSHAGQFVCGYPLCDSTECKRAHKH